MRGGLLLVQQLHSVQHGGAEGQRLAGAGTGLADQVGAAQRERNGQRLNGEGMHDTGLGEGGRDGLVEAKICEGFFAQGKLFSQCDTSRFGSAGADRALMTDDKTAQRRQS